MHNIVKKNKVLHPDLSYKICGICFQAHNELGIFRSEKSYADKIEDLLIKNQLKYRREIPLKESFEGEKARRNVPDFIIEDKIVLEIKAKRIFGSEEYYQLRRYLDSSNIELGILVNFRRKYLQPKRVLNANLYSEHSDKNS